MSENEYKGSRLVMQLSFSDPYLLSVNVRLSYDIIYLGLELLECDCIESNNN